MVMCKEWIILDSLSETGTPRICAWDKKTTMDWHGEGRL